MSKNHNAFPIATNVGIVGLTPDPENLGPPHFNELPPFTEPIEFPNPGGKVFPFTTCKLKFPEGCYRISMISTLASPFRGQKNFEGTMRVENVVDNNGNKSHAISGDFYRKPVKFGFPPGLELNELALALRPVIPIFSRSRYHSYLKVVGIRKSKLIRLGQKCTIELTVEEYNYSPPATDAGHGNFPETPTRTLRIVLNSVAPPAGHSGPSFEGRVFDGATPLTVLFKMEWVSKFFRRASLELENVVGAAIPSSAGANDFKSIYATAGWDLTVITGDTNLAVPAGVSAANPWSNAELHAFMLANRNSGVSLDQNWRYYYVSVPHSSDSGAIFGIMFDQIGDQREGSCNFINNMTGNFSDAFSKLRSAAHEIGHGFNQLHPQNENETENQGRENFIMTQSGDTRAAIIAAGGTYPDDIRFEFSPHHRHHLVHAPDMVVRPGGEDFGFGHGDVLSGSFNPEDAELATDLGLTLTFDTVRNHIKLGEPLVLKIELTNSGNTDISIPQSIAWTRPNTNIAVGQVGYDMRTVSSFAHVCDSTSQQVLAPGKSIKTEELVYWDTQGFVFTRPGVHKVEVTTRWNSDGYDMALKAEKYVWVDFPVTSKENEAAALLMHPDVGKYVALGGNAKHLATAVERIAETGTLAKDHPAYDIITQLDNSGKKKGKK